MGVHGRPIGQHSKPLKAPWETHGRPMGAHGSTTIHRSSMVVPSVTQGSPWEVPWETHGSSMGQHYHPSGPHGIPMGYPWASTKNLRHSHGKPMWDSWGSLPWEFHGVIVLSHGTSLGLPWDSHGTSMGSYFSLRTSMGLPWDSDGTSMRAPWCFHDFILHGTAILGFPWDSHG